MNIPTFSYTEIKPGPISQMEYECLLDRFIRINSNSKKVSRVRIITGKGLRSKNFINNKNPIRFYTEQYLIKTGYSWVEEDYFFGGGTVLVEL